MTFRIAENLNNNKKLELKTSKFKITFLAPMRWFNHMHISSSDQLSKSEDCVWTLKENQANQGDQS